MIKLTGAAMHATDFLVELFEKCVKEGRLLTRSIGFEIRNSEDLDCELHQRLETMTELLRSFFRVTPDYLVEDTTQLTKLEMALFNQPFCSFFNARYLLRLTRFNSKDYAVLIAVTIQGRIGLDEDLIISGNFPMRVDSEPGGTFLASEPTFRATELAEPQHKWIQKWIDRITKVVNKKSNTTREKSDD